MKRNCSIVIPTCNRKEDLKLTFDTILNQTFLPKEIIIVDDGDNAETEELCKDLEGLLLSKNIKIKYIRKIKNKSAAISRNIGADNATADIVFFLDDDVLLENDYIEQIISVYEINFDAIGVQGYIKNRRKSKIKNIINSFFFLTHSRKNCNLLLPSMQNVYADPLDKIIICQWMVGNNFSFKRNIFESFRFDEKLKKISSSEDADLTYRIYKKYPSSLYQTPYARLIHKGSVPVRGHSEQVITLTQVYHLYLSCKNFKKNFKNTLIYIWSLIGLFAISVGVTLMRLPEAKILNPLSLLKSYFFCFKNFKKISCGELNFFNQKLK